ncbi:MULTISPECIES: sensor domain-containing diguanylate cyclase [Acinetobacter]|jgi:diguanylate cyclase (GGDEF)-like protein|uniref:Sensor domain-containing diguanylate cyclase n=2 Tax=Acinetobacter TaxID=469 RepID=A0A4Q7AWH4_9GAMM|nr:MULTISPECIES: sensor domain-containing diguanylate cyclase [Acinetobacter]MCW8039355.1 diguanylate cyclase [Acinetobacter entericus]RZG66413.1 sensor domain-containing diguanylate cyclase [Acinetobacter bouvetii]TCB73360.1 sensor domain-containing diguanylate cyclase [Acinetobacter sp. ANC 4177]
MKQLYTPITLHQLFTRSQLTIFVLTFTICSAIFLVISTYTMNAYAKSSLNILTEALNERIQPAVVFNDRLTINQILNEYIQQYPIRAIEINTPSNSLLAHAEQKDLQQLSSQSFLDHLFYSQPIYMNIEHNQQNFGKLIVYGNSSELVIFFHKILLALLIGFILLLATAYWAVNSVYQYLMHSIRIIVESAQMISVKKNYNMRVSSSDIQELQALSTAFNGLLSEIEQSNHTLLSENNKLLHQSKHDPLTLLPNRSFFYQELFKLFEAAEPQNAAVLLLDLNHFKNVNEKFGHLAGDAVLRASSYCVKKVLPEDAFFSRLGGDEFAIIIPNICVSADITHHCQRIQECFASTFIFEQQNISLSISIGAAFTHKAKTPEELIANADHALCKAKQLNEKWYIYPKLDNK